MATKDSKTPKAIGIFDYYLSTLKSAQDIIKILNENGTYIDASNPYVESSIKSSKNTFILVNRINRIFLIPAKREEEFFLNSIYINKGGEAVHSSRCDGGVMKKDRSIKKMIKTFNDELTCESFKIRAMVKLDGTVISFK